MVRSPQKEGGGLSLQTHRLPAEVSPGRGFRARPFRGRCPPRAMPAPPGWVTLSWWLALSETSFPRLSNGGVLGGRNEYGDVRDILAPQLVAEVPRRGLCARVRREHFRKLRPFLCFAFSPPRGARQPSGGFSNSETGGRVCGKGTWREEEAPTCGSEGKVILKSLVTGEVAIGTTARGQARPRRRPECKTAKTEQSKCPCGKREPSCSAGGA